jgi:hypothetical protein
LNFEPLNFDPEPVNTYMKDAGLNAGIIASHTGYC